MIHIVLSIMAILLCGASPVCAGEYPLPPDGPAVDVTRPPFGAEGDGKTDDSEALNHALQAASKDMRLVYLPRGVYLVSRPLLAATRLLLAPWEPSSVGIWDLAYGVPKSTNPC